MEKEETAPILGSERALQCFQRYVQASCSPRLGALRLQRASQSEANLRDGYRRPFPTVSSRRARPRRLRGDSLVSVDVT